jgi:hypothetical protein
VFNMRILLPTLGLLFAFGLLDLGMAAPAAAQNNQRVTPQRGHTVSHARVAVTQQHQQPQRIQNRRVRHNRGQRVEVPELDPSMGAQGLALLLGVTLLVGERRRKSA